MLAGSTHGVACRANRSTMAVLQKNNDDPVASHSLSPRELKVMLAAERAGVPFLAYRDQQRALVLVTLDDGADLRTIGRRLESDIAVYWDGEVSGLHAELQRRGREWTVVDDGLSTNGTFLNGERISGRERLRDGDRLRVGRTTVLVFNAAQAECVGTTVAAAELAPMPHVTETQRRVLIALCRPYRDRTSFATPASNQQIAEETFLSVETVKMHLRALFSRFGLAELSQNQKRARLAEVALRVGVISRRDLA